MTPPIRPLVLALSLGLLALASTDAHAQRKRAAARAPAVPAQCTDFYAQANAEWLKANPVPADPGAASALGQLAARSLQQQRDLLDAAMQSPQNEVQKRLGDFWASGLDEAAVEADGSKPIAPLLSRIDAIKRAKDVPAAIAALHQVGIPVAFNFAPDVDLKALDRHIGYFMQGGMGLPDPAFYTRGDADTQALLGRYGDYVKQVLALTGTPQARLEADTRAVIDIETAIARKSQSMADLNNPFRTYVPVPAADVAKRYRNLQLAQFLEAQGVKDDLVSLPDPALFAELDAMVARVKPEQWRAYLRWRVGDAMAPYLSRSFREASFGFRGQVLAGQAAPAPRWQQVLEAINTAAGPMLGREYAERHLTPAARRRAGVVIDEVREAQVAAVARAAWLSDEAKAEAAAKLKDLKIEVGTPRRDLDYTVQPMGRGSFGGNMLIASAWRHREEMRRIGKGNADRRWDVLPQQPALAYDIAQNRLIVTAAVLQPPVFDAADPAMVYGAYGALVGNQLTRAVDAKGALVDARGELRSWWTPADKSAWLHLGERVANQYAAYDYPGVKGAKVNGTLVRDEGLGDLAGLELAWEAYAKAHADAKPAERQAFFQAWSRMWAQQLSPNAASERLTADIHAPGPLRSNVPLGNLPAFAAAYGCKAGQPMQRAEAEQIRVWR
ncbi:peptidase M13 [Pseudoxanthomonas broegbernensis]|uniref:Peptidase M13 n=1 Tax=Pseudoxanthomonas broegbernensis TaxID=83619 RepID=A0A7V8K8I0_9GAMM|nr:M13 family metallopeptidase [Pseudoxanthomonas broegbernensis]KAF1687736.1 peptidase M13 [Pseudoxanthomonas broegbernensis]MBB6064770.1 putative endopeptidase [Pseudoxanthomonas broegbernensis]